MVNTRNVVTYEAMVYRGTIDTVQIRIGELFRPALIYNAANIILTHNHPSGSSLPSPEDVKVTERVVTAGKLLGVEVLDHVIMGKQTFSSLREKKIGALSLHFCRFTRGSTS
jgi:DNA repair protein RadC